MVHSRRSCLSLILPVLLLPAFPANTNCQSPNFATVVIGQTSAAQSATLTFTSSGTLATELALTQGAQNQDFKMVPGGSCATGQSYTTGNTCTVDVTFGPLYAGLRRGALVLEDASGNPLASSYIFGVGSGPQAAFQITTQQLTTFPNETFAADRGIAVDGNGNLFVSSVNSSTANESVVEVPSGCTAESCIKQLPGTFYAVWGLAIDGAGNLWVGDVGANGTITEIPAAGGYSATNVYTGTFGNQYGVAVDGAGNVYFTGAGTASADKVTELLASSGYTTAQILASGFNTLGGIAVDASGNVFFADPFDQVVQEIEAVSGSIPATPTIKPLGSGMRNLSGLAIDGGGNIYTTGNDSEGVGIIFELTAGSGYSAQTEFSRQTNPLGVVIDAGGDIFGIYYTVEVLGGTSTTSAVFEIPRGVAPPIIFSYPTAPGVVDTVDGTQEVNVESIGNQPLSLAGLKVSNANFSLDPTTTCTASTTLLVGDSCLVAVNFNPQATGSITGAVNITDNTLNGSSTVQSIALSGESLYTPLVIINLSTPVAAVTQALPLTITVNGGAGNPTPTGTIQLSAPGYSPAPVTLSGGSASVTVPAGTLSVGQPVITAIYTPDAAGAMNFAGAGTAASILITSTVLNVPQVTVTPAVYGISVGQALTVTVNVSQVNGAPVPTGSVVLVGGSYTSPPATLSSGAAAITIPANSLGIGTNALLATYTPDAASSGIYVPASGSNFVAVGAVATTSGASPVDFGSLPVGATSAAQLITLTFPDSSTPASLVATTKGATGQDFAIVAGGSCGVSINVAAGQSCTVKVTFTPGYAGVRSGAVVAEDANGETLALTYVHGSGTGPQITFQSGYNNAYYGPGYVVYPFSFTTLSNGFSHPNVAVDGAGNVFEADLGTGAVKEVPVGCTSASCTITVLQAFDGPSALAVDGAGNIFVAEAGFGDVKKIPLGCTSYTCLQTVGSGFNQPYGLFVDPAGNVYVADTYNNAIKEIVAAGGYTTINTLATGLDLPWSVVVDTAGDLFVAEGGDQCAVFIPGTCSTINTSLLEIPAAGGYKTVNTLASGVFGKPFGLAIDGADNVYEANYGDPCANEFSASSGYTAVYGHCAPIFGSLEPEGMALDSAGNIFLGDVLQNTISKFDYVDVPAMRFKYATLEGQQDVLDGSQVVSVTNGGTAPLTFASISLSDTSFKLDSTLNTCSTSTPLAPGTKCFLAVDFLPTRTGPISATLTLTDNNLNQSPATHIINITAMALPPTPVILSNPANPTTATSATFTFSDTQTPITFVCSIDTLPFSACASPENYPGLSGGPHTFQVKAEDAAGNLSQAAVYNWTVNSVGPPAPVLTSEPAAFTNDSTAAFTFTDAQSGVTFQCSLDGAAFTSCASGISYTGLVVPTNAFIARHSFAVEAMDASSNASPETTWSWTVTIDKFSAYPVNFGTVAVGQTSSAQSVTFNITAADTVTTIDATTLGITGLDFAVSDPGTCAVGTALAKGATCTLQATFTPKYPGQRKGAVLLLDASGNGIGEAYLEGTGSAPQVTFGPYSTVNYNILPPQNNADPGKNLLAPAGDVAVDGAGNVYATDFLIASQDETVGVSSGDIWKFPPGCTQASCSVQVATDSGLTDKGVALDLPVGLVIDGAGVLWPGSFYLPYQQYMTTVGVWSTTQCGVNNQFSEGLIGVAVDGAGNLATSGGAVIQNCSQSLGLGQTSQTGSFDFGGNTPSITVDPQKNYFVADTANNAIKEVLASSNYTIDRPVGSSFSGPVGVASDAYGNIYVSDTLNNAIKEIVASSGYTQVLTIATFAPGFYQPGNLTVDALGNVYVADSALYSTISNPGATNQFFKLDFSDAPTLTFPTATKIGTTDATDGTITATVKNNGNQPLVISGMALSNTNFSIDSRATTCSVSAPVAVGATCTIGVFFTPNATGAVTGTLTGTLTLTDNALNATGSTQQFQISGTAYLTPTTATPTVAVVPASGTITTAQTDVVTVTVSGAAGNPTPTGAVSLIGGNYTSAALSLSGGTAIFTIPAGVLAVGATTVNAVYSPDTASSATYGVGANSASITVTAVPATTPTVTLTPAAINISTQQNLPVTIAVSGGSGQPTPTGTVTIAGGNFASQAAPLANGSVSVTIPSGYLPAGTVTLTAYYTPDATAQVNYTNASGTGQVVVEAAQKLTPAVTVTPALGSITTNQPLQVTLQVSGGAGKSTPTGSIVLSSGSFVSTAAVLTQGIVIVTVPARSLAQGTDTLTANYTPDNASSLTFSSAAGSGSVNVTLSVANTSTTLQASATSITVGASITFTASVAETSGTAIPTGTVAFMDSASTLGTGMLNGSGVAIFPTSSLGLGAHSITAVYQGNANNAGSTSTPIMVTVNPLTAQAINFTQPSTPVTYSSGLTIPLVATGGASGNPVVFSLDASSTGAGSISSSLLTVTTAGTFVIDANQAGNANYSAAPQVQRTVVVNQIAQAINFTQPTSPVTYSGSSLTVPLSATGGASGNAVVFSIDASSTATGNINGSTLTITSIGTLVIDANQAGNANYSVAPRVQRTVVVDAPTPQAITFTQPTTPVTYSSDFTISLVAIGGGSGNPVVFSLDAGSTGAGSISSSLLTVTTAGTFVIDANQAGNSTYAAAPQVQRSVVVNKASQAISFTQPTSPVTYSGSSLTVPLSATGGASGNAVVFSIDASSTATGNINGSTLTITSIGTLVIDANQAGNANYSVAPQVQRSIAVNPPSPDFSITTTSSSQTVAGGTAAVFTVTVTPENGFDSTVALSEIGAPAGATATFAPPSLTPSEGAVSSNLTVTTTPLAEMSRPSLWPLSAPVLAFILIAPFKRWRRVWSGKMMLLIVGLVSLTALAGIGGCGGGFGLLQSQTYTLTISGTAGSTVHSTTVQLTVKQ